MIYFRHANGSRCLPPWLPQDVRAERLTANGLVVGMCDPMYLDPMRVATWLPCADGWDIGQAGDDPKADQYLRREAWLPVQVVADHRDRPWLAPCVLDAAGRRNFPVAYAGPLFLPAPTPEQARLMAVAGAAREAFQIAAAEAAAAEQAGRDVDPDKCVATATACAWAAQLLAGAYHLPVEAFQALGLIDDTLAELVPLVAAGLRAPSRAEAG